MFSAFLLLFLIVCSVDACCTVCHVYALRIKRNWLCLICWLSNEKPKVLKQRESETTKIGRRKEGEQEIAILIFN